MPKIDILGTYLNIHLNVPCMWRHLVLGGIISIQYQRITSSLTKVHSTKIHGHSYGKWITSLPPMQLTILTFSQPQVFECAIAKKNSIF